MMMKSPVPPVGLAQMTRILGRVPTRASFGTINFRRPSHETQYWIPRDGHRIVMLEFFTFLFY